MPGCVVKWCRSHTRIKCPEITFHYFPADPIRQNKWIAAVKLERQENDWMPVKTSRVCSIHFHENDFYESLKGYAMLYKAAVPVCTMIRPEETSTSLRDAIKNEKINNADQSHLACEYSPSGNYEVCDLPELLNKTNTADTHLALMAQKRKLENNLDTGCNDAAEEEPRSKLRNNLVSTEVHSFEERGSCVTPINKPSSYIEPGLNSLSTHNTHMLQQKLRKKSILAATRLSQIRNLERRNKRLTMKNIKLKNRLSELKKNVSATLKKMLH